MVQGLKSAEGRDTPPLARPRPNPRKKKTSNNTKKLYTPYSAGFFFPSNQLSRVEAITHARTAVVVV